MCERDRERERERDRETERKNYRKRMYSVKECVYTNHAGVDFTVDNLQSLAHSLLKMVVIDLLLRMRCCDFQEGLNQLPLLILSTQAIMCSIGSRS